MTIKNRSDSEDPHVTDMRNAIEHRATWLYFLLDEAKQQGANWNAIARKAIFQCGCFHGETRFADNSSLPEFARQFANELYQKIFAMEVVECDKDTFIVEFHYCPLVAAWLKQTDNEKKISELCDIAMEGDRGIVSTLHDFTLELHGTIAAGAESCRIEIRRKNEAQPLENHEQTRRQKMIAVLRQEKAVPLSYLAQHFSLTTKMIEEDLQHIAKNKAYKLEQLPPGCESCGFVFRKREKYHKPSRCPKCKSENISEGMIKLKSRGGSS